MKTIEIIHYLRKAKGTNAKLAILRGQSSNEAWKKFLFYTYSPDKSYYVSAPAVFDFTNTEEDDQMYDVLDAFSEREVSGNQAKAMAKTLSRVYGEIPRLVLGGSVKAGISVTSINKCYPGLVPTYPLMLGSSEEVTTFPCLMSIKFDGVRCLSRVEDGVVTNRTRSGKILNIESLSKEMSKLPDGVYDGELVKRGGLQKDRTSISGDVNRVLSGTVSDLSKYSFAIFDRVSLQEWDSQIGVATYEYRLNFLKDIRDDFNVVNSSHLKVAEQHEASCKEDIDLFYSTLVEKGYEGVIVRHKEDVYVWGRSEKLIKQKAILECTLECKEVMISSSTKYNGLIGSLFCVGVINGKDVSVNVGSGLSGFDREQPDEIYVGSLIEIEYNDLVKSKTGVTHSLFLPRFKRIGSSIGV